MPNLTARAWHEWRDGWACVCAGMIGSAATQIHFASLGVFIQPISQAMAWASSTMTLGIFICAAVAVPGAPFAGWLAHRFGLRRVLLAGLPLFFGAFGLLGWLSHTQSQWIFCWILIALAGVPVKANVWMLWIAQRFDVARGLAFGLIAAGAGVLAIFVPFMTQLCIERFGWRLTFPILALTMAFAALVASLLGMRLCPPLMEDIAAPTDPALAKASGLSIREASRFRGFWQIGAIAFLLGVGIVSLQIHLVPMLREKHLDARTAAMTAGFFGAAALVSRFVVGALLDRYPARLIGLASLLLPAGACAIYYAVAMDRAVGAVIAVLSGVGVGAEGDVVGYITAKYFGVRKFGTVYGAMIGAFALGSGVGPLLISTLHDHLGSYELVVPIVFVTLVACAALFMTLGRHSAATFPAVDATPALPP